MRKVGEIMGSTTKEDVIVLGGREFKRVKNGLDEAPVASFISELIKERDKLAKSQEHIISLNRLAEMAVVEADRLAAQIKTEAAEHAKAESAAIIDKTKEQARQLSEKKIAEAIEIANEKAKTIKAKAEEEAALLLENEKNKIRNELRNLVNQQFGYLLEELERLKQQAAAIQSDFDNKSPELGEEKSSVTEKIAERIDAAAVKIAEKRDAAAAEIAKESPPIVAEESKEAPAEHWEPSLAPDQAEKSSELPNLLEMEEEVKTGKPQWEVEILPPLDIAKIMEVVSFLDQLPEVANTEMIVPQIDMPSILVFLCKPMNFVAVLKTIPIVAYVEEIKTDKAITDGKPSKVRIGFSGHTTPQGKK
jgi:hypothetical protein